MNKVLILAAVLLPTFVCLAQAPPNLENGFKAWGSYNGSHVDTVNLLNGNQMLHAPLLPNYPQRGGKLSMQPFLHTTSKNWQLSCSGVDAGGNPICGWGMARVGVDVRTIVGLTVQRTLHESGSGTGTTTYSTFGYSVQDPSGVMHRMTPTGPASGPIPEYDSIDTTGYHLHLSDPDTYGVMQTATVTDRQGNQYTAGGWIGGTDTGPALCPQLPGNRLPPAGLGGGLIEPNVDDAPLGQQDCPQVSYLQHVTDSNGNLIDGAVDTLGRTMPFMNPGIQTTLADGCSTTHVFAYALTYAYAAPDGSTPQLKLCYAYIPINAVFGGPWAGTVTSSGGPQLVTVILGDGTKWTFDYDNYGEVTSIGLPTGGSINYTWTEISFPSCAYPDGGVSRAVATRTLNDNNGHSFLSTYHWGTVVNGVINNFVTDPLGNDTVHVFTALDGTGLAQCSFFETQTQYFQGTGGSRQLLKQVDTTYSGVIFNIETSFGTGPVHSRSPMTRSTGSRQAGPQPTPALSPGARITRSILGAI